MMLFLKFAQFLSLKNNSQFPFSYLQPSGGGSKILVVPSQSSLFKWTPQQVARLRQSGTIYILAQDALKIDEFLVGKVLIV